MNYVRRNRNPVGVEVPFVNIEVVDIEEEMVVGKVDRLLLHQTRRNIVVT